MVRAGVRASARCAAGAACLAHVGLGLGLGHAARRGGTWHLVRGRVRGRVRVRNRAGVWVRVTSFFLGWG